MRLAAATSVRDIIASLDDSRSADLVVIDSIQTMYLDTLDSAPGTVSQVRGAAQELIALAKRRGLILVLVGHVTKEGLIAGPRVLEHMVDTVLYFEGERGHQFRILRAVKNRFGPTDEIGVFEMTDGGLVEVPNPSALFLAERPRRSDGDDDAGSAAPRSSPASRERRPVLVEIQALVAPSLLGTPRRAVVGWDGDAPRDDHWRCSTRAAASRSAANDIYLNVAGGLRIGEPAADLAVAAALVSALTEPPVPAEPVIFGEIGLVRRGAARWRRPSPPQGGGQARLCRGLGAASAGGAGNPGSQIGDGLATVPIGHLSELVARLAPAPRRRIHPTGSRRLVAAP